VAVTGGLEAVTDSVLERMNKGVTTNDAVKTSAHFAEAGVLTHAYLIYSFPGQTINEGIDALELIRQMYYSGVLHSSYWHRFSLTAHSPITANPEKYGIIFDSTPAPFANNDLEYEGGGDIDILADGLKKANFNFMHGSCFEEPLSIWFKQAVPRPTVDKNFVENLLAANFTAPAERKVCYWLGTSFGYEKSTKNMANFSFELDNQKKVYSVPYQLAAWLRIIMKSGQGKGDTPHMKWRDAVTLYPHGIKVPLSDTLQTSLWFDLRSAGLIFV
jgi:hypothetical protein